jgi:hypothetical protein
MTDPDEEGLSARDKALLKRFDALAICMSQQTAGMVGLTQAMLSVADSHAQLITALLKVDGEDVEETPAQPEAQIQHPQILSGRRAG